MILSARICTQKGEKNMKLGKKIVSLMIVLVMIATTIFGINISNAVALTNEQKAQELVSKMTLEEKR